MFWGEVTRGWRMSPERAGIWSRAQLPLSNNPLNGMLASRCDQALGLKAASLVLYLPSRDRWANNYNQDTSEKSYGPWGFSIMKMRTEDFAGLLGTRA